MKRILAILLACTFVFSGWAVAAETLYLAQGYCDGGIQWTLSQTGTLTFTGEGDMTDYSYGIGGYLDKVTKVVINPGMTRIGHSAFSGMVNLTEVSIPNTVTEIGGSAFYGCKSLTTVTLPSSVTKIDGYLFANSGLKAFAFPNSITEVEMGMFEGCTDLTDVTLSPDTTKIHYYAFKGCTKLTTLALPDALKSIGMEAFMGCAKLENIALPAKLTGLDHRAFSGCTSLKSVAIPGSLYDVGSYCFEGCTSLSSATLGEGISYIHERVFSGCSALDNVTIPLSLNSLSNGMFENCRSLKTVRLHEKIGTIPNYCFAGCTSLEEAPLPVNVGSIYTGAFSGCISLKTVDLPEEVHALGADAFAECTSLKAVHFPAGLTDYNDFAFRGCSSLTDITVDDQNYIYYDRDGVLLDVDGRVLWCPAGKTGRVTLPSFAKSIGEYAFADSGLSKVVIFPEVGEIADNAFEGSSITVVGEVGSYAEEYATAHGIAFKAEELSPEVWVEDKTGQGWGLEVSYDGNMIDYVPEEYREQAILYNLILTQYGDRLYFPEEPVTVWMVIPENMRELDLEVYSMAERGFESLHATREGDYMVFTTDMFGTTVLAIKGEPVYETGDVSGDGEVTATDALNVLQCATGKVALTPEQEVAADVNQDGNVNTNDALLVLQFATKKITHF